MWPPKAATPLDRRVATRLLALRIERARRIRDELKYGTGDRRDAAQARAC
jgi:hypothetical protein